MSRMYADSLVILDLDYLVAAQPVCRGGTWMLDVLLGIGTEGQTVTVVYPTAEACTTAFDALCRCLQEVP